MAIEGNREKPLNAYPTSLLVPIFVIAEILTGFGFSGAIYDLLDEKLSPITIGDYEIINPGLLASGAAALVAGIFTSAFLIQKINKPIPHK